MSGATLLISGGIAEGDAASVLAGHLARTGRSERIDLLVVGVAGPAPVAALPPAVRLHRLEVGDGIAANGLLALRTALAASGSPCLEGRYDVAIAVAPFRDVLACAAFSLCRAARKVIVLSEAGLPREPLAPEAGAAIRGALLSADHVASPSRSLLDELAGLDAFAREIPSRVAPTLVDRRGPGKEIGAEARRESPPPPLDDGLQTLADLLDVPPRARPRPVVTILVPTHDQERFVGTAIQSALMQDFPALEVVVCDDASTDGTLAVARRRADDPRLRIRSNPANLGRVANYRTALESEARGDWVLMLDGDDHLVDPCFVGTAMRALAEHAGQRPSFVQAGHRLVWLSADGSVSPDRRPIDLLPAIPGKSRLLSGGDYLRFVYETGFFTHLGTLYSREAAIRQGFYALDVNSSDMDSLLRLALSGNVVVLRAIAGCWVQHGANHSANLPLERIEENARIYRRIALEGAAAGVVDLPRLDPFLTRYEGWTLSHFFDAAVGKSAHRVSDAFEMIRIARRVHPRVLLQPRLVATWCLAFARLARMSLARLLGRGAGTSLPPGMRTP